jgi:hypothetical protein
MFSRIPRDFGASLINRNANMSKTTKYDIRNEVRVAISADGNLLSAAQHCAELGLLPKDGKLDGFKVNDDAYATFVDEATLQYSAGKALHYIMKSEVDGKIEIVDPKAKDARVLSAEMAARMPDADYRKVAGSNDDMATLKHHVKKFRDSVKELVSQLYRRMARRLAQEQAKAAGAARAVKAPLEIIRNDLAALLKHGDKNKACSAVQYAIEAKKLTDAVSDFTKIVLA